MEQVNMMGFSQFDVELKILVDALLRDVCALAVRWSAALQQQITASRTENQELRHRLHILEQQTLSPRTGMGSVAHSDTHDKLPAPGECAKETVDTGSGCIEASQWRRIKEEEMEIFVTGRAEHRLDASCSDVLHTTHTEVNCQHSELKTECEGKIEPEIQEPESGHSGDDGVDSEEDTQDCWVVDDEYEAEDHSTQLGHPSPPKTEEEEEEEGGERDDEQEQFAASHLLTPDLQYDSIPLPNNSNSSDCSMFVILEGNTEVSPTGQHSDLAVRATGSSKSKKPKGPRYICNICGKSLSSKYSLTVHFTMHTGDRPHACTQCGKRFVNRTNLEIHQNIHTGAKPYVCPLCPKSFADPSPLGRHKRMHSKTLQQSSHSTKCQYICNICGKSLSTKQGLSYHITMHTGERPYTCTWCGKSFVQKHNLKIHQNIHTGAKPYACTICPKSFADPSSLKKHNRMHVVVPNRNMEESHFHVQLTAILDVLMKTAVSDICALADSWVQSLQREIRRSRKENQDLRQKLYSLEQQPPAEPQVEKQSTKAEEEAVSSQQTCKKMVENSESESAASKKGQWCVMLQKWNPVPVGAKAEVMDRSFSESEEEMQDATSGDAVCTPVCPGMEGNLQYEIKTESEKPPTHFQKSECTADISADCEDEYEEPAVLEEEYEAESIHHVSQPKREEEEEFDISCLLTPDLHFNSTQALGENPTEPTNSDCRMNLNLDTDFNLSVTAHNDEHSSDRTLVSLSCDKQTGRTFICNICGKTLTTKRSFICHLRLHTGEKPFMCTQCGKRFAKKFNLDIHYNVHSGARPYVCALCPRSFADPSAFGRHKMMHRKKSQTDTYSPKCKFICNICGQSFSSKPSLAVHSKFHTAERQHGVQKVLFRNMH
ncbi:hypothetical protein NFI96_011139 [Prochilodus magdalenae]|nr:hypothetical protein NFI96_011139 [Prochilodus magdalenae]